jgi:HSP20 family protein
MADQRKSNESSQERYASQRKESTPTAHERAGQLARLGREQSRGMSWHSNFDPPEVLVSPGEFLLNPWVAMHRMNEQMQRLFAHHALGGSRHSSQMEGWSPAIEVAERGDNLVVSAELPGMSEDDVCVEISDDALILQGERRVERHEEEEGGIRRTERQYGRFYRAIPLPDGANADGAQAEFNNGVLEVTVPLTQNRRRQIPISAQRSRSQKQGGETIRNETGGKKAA